MFAMLDQHIVCCLDAIVDPEEKNILLKEMEEGGRKVINISHYEMTQMCGNMVQVKDGKTGELCVLMSQKARDGLSAANRNELESTYRIVSSDISMIETIGGGSARCMTIELFWTASYVYTIPNNQPFYKRPATTTCISDSVIIFTI